MAHSCGIDEISLVRHAKLGSRATAVPLLPVAMVEHMSRRAFVESVLAGAAGGVIPQIAIGADDAPGGATRPIPDTGPTTLSLSEASRLLRQKKVSPVELTQACLARIESLNPTLNAFITVTAESALDAARNAEAQIARGGWKGPLHGIPIAVKDLLDTAGVRTTAASALFKDRVPAQDAEVVRRLRAAGAVLLGKLNMHEPAFGGGSGVNHLGALRNTSDVAYSPGGSSRGSAAAVGRGGRFLPPRSPNRGVDPPTP